MAVTQAPRVRSGAVPLRTFKAQGRRSAIVGLGTYVPEGVVTNGDLEKLVETSDQWIRERTGIERRHFAAKGTTTYSLATAAGRAALADAGVAAEELDMILVATSTPDAPFPSTACRVQGELGVPGAVAFDLLAACTGFVYGLSVADAYIASGRAETVLVIGAEVLSRNLDWGKRGTAVIFGDGAGAAVLRPAPEGAGFVSWCLGSDGRGYDQVTCGLPDYTPYTNFEAVPIIDMKGPDVFKFATDIFNRQAFAVAEEAGITVDDFDLWVPHQANRRIIEAAARRIGLPIEKVAVNIQEYGNTSTATIPLALKDAVDAGRVKSGDKVLMAGFGSGLTWGAALLEWA